MDTLRRAPSATRFFLACLCLFLGLGLLATARPARAQMTMVETGFVCILINGDFAKQVEIGVGPDTCIYYGSNDGLKKRCPPSTTETICDPALTFPAGVAFGPGGAWGTSMYVADFGVGDIFKHAGCATGTFFSDFFAPGAIAFPPAGSAYGDYLYACEAFEGPIYRVASNGTKTSWLEIETVYLKFGPGGAWGNGMYATRSLVDDQQIVKISSSAVVTPLATDFLFPEGFDWAFDGDMFATDAAMGQIWRVKPNGSKTLFATLPGAADVAFRPGEQALYAVSNQGGLWRITRGGAAGVEGVAGRAALLAWPNPAAAGCALRFALGESGIVEVDVWDVAGRRVRALGTTWRAAGAHDLPWDGRNDAGARVAPGTYFARVRTPAATLRTAVTIVR